MKNLISMMVVLLLVANHAIAQKIEKPVRQVPVKILKTAPTNPAPPPPPAPVSKTTGTTGNTGGEPLEYRLTSVRVKIRTGSDNKEFPSRVSAHLKARNLPATANTPFNQWALSNEMRINSETEFGLDRAPQLTGDASLATLQASGFMLFIVYEPNFFADAWKIEGVTVILEFKDQHGNLHPTLGSKTIVFPNAYGFLNNDFRRMDCTTDGSFVPQTANIRRI